ncbi:hypothetical protein GIB67_005693 [Kingdonia uniflora]|uniref:ENTH domain-containing protein n=1 Tax=Kingdonia uniflora TaxID=39325 RepID=A0A7J7NI33_9MAGN|nr:hypothetical protein GIB67_005693 [Kingdonia uniflora]
MGQQSKLRYRDLLGVLKDKASLTKAVILTSSLNLTIVRATTHDPSTIPHEKDIDTLLSYGHSSRIPAANCINAIMNRLQNTHDSFVAFKCLVMIHYIIRRGSFILQDQLTIYPLTGGHNYLNLSKFRDNSSLERWEMSSWVRWYARVLEYILCTFRIMGFFICSVTSHPNSSKQEHEEKVSALMNIDLIKEIDTLTGFIEELCRAPELLNIRDKGLVHEVMRLMGEEFSSSQREILIRLSELEQRVGTLSFGDSVELVCIFKRLESCKERLLVLFINRKGGLGEVLWGLIRDLKEKVTIEKECGERRLVKAGWRGKFSESARFGERILRLGDSVMFSSGRMALDWVPTPILESG